MIEVESNAHFNEIIANHPKCVMFFGSENCHHCQNMMVFIESVIDEYPQITFAHIETTKVPVKDLKAVPVFLLYHHGELFDHQLGAGEKRLDSLLQALDEVEDDDRVEDDEDYEQEEDEEF